jgi:hypothetical protein
MNKEKAQKVNNILASARADFKNRGVYIMEKDDKRATYYMNGLASEKVFEKMVKDIHKVIGYKPQKR